MQKILTVCAVVLLAGCLLSMAIPWAGEARVNAAVATNTPLPKKRIQVISSDYTRYEWWLIRWSSNKVVCQIFIDLPGMPTSSEIYKSCGKDIHEDWRDTTSCKQSESQDSSKCQGVYLHSVGISQDKRKVEVELPMPTVWLSLQDCSPSPDQPTACSNVPNLLLEAEEPLPNENIIQIQGIANGNPFTCPGVRCIIPLKPTGVNGFAMEFWADSSLGDSSEHFTALVRMVPWGDFANPEPDAQPQDQQLWYVDVISSQWKGNGGADACAESWQVFPNLGGAPEWLSTPVDVTALQSSYSYHLLAGALIKNRIVDASECDQGGLEDGILPNNCGVEKARPKVMEWQNLFDEEILKVSGQTGIPAFLIKNIFSRESQFWPGVLQDDQEVGLGQLTENGADAVLLWNPHFFSQFCPLVLARDVCDLGFGNLTSAQQKMLRGALVNKVDATCADCPIGIDLTRANYSIQVFAETMRANCEQTGQLIRNITRKAPYQVSNYNDLWRYTIINYNAGPGCLAIALRKGMVVASGKLDWLKVASNLDPVCKSALTYLESVSNEQIELPSTPTPILAVTPTRTPSPTFTSPKDENGEKTATPTSTPDDNEN
jgi:hypothetical protein